MMRSKIRIVLSILILILSVYNTHALTDYNGFNMTVTFSPEILETLDEGDTVKVVFNYTCCPPVSSRLTVQVSDQAVALVSAAEDIMLPVGAMATGHLYSASVNITGKRLGGAYLLIYLHPQNESFDSNQMSPISEDYRIIVQRKKTIHDLIFQYMLMVVIVLIYLGFGCEIELKIIMAYIKKPIQIGIGAFCQFVFMPLIGFTVAILLKLDKVFAFGLLMVCCSPGGGNSNIWSKVLSGDMNLSITMTFFSTALSLGVMPLWMFLLGRFFIDTSRVTIPYKNIALSLLFIMIPCLLGILLTHFKPKFSAKLARINKFFIAFFIIVIMSYGTYVNFYIFQLIFSQPKIFPAAAITPLVGFILGCLAALIFRQPYKKVITIAIETACQNPSIGILILQRTFPQPDGDLGAVMPLALAFFAPIPLVTSLIVLVIYRCFCKKKKENTDEIKEEAGDTKLSLIENKE